MPRITRTTTVLALGSIGVCGVLLVSGCAATTTSGDTPAAETTSAVDAEVSVASADCQGVWLAIDFDIMDAAPIDQCIPTTEPVDGLAVLAEANVTVEGTADYGLDVVCRVNGLPSATTQLNLPGHESYRERCEKMTPEFAYWSVWVEDRATGAWDYAPVGIDALSLNPGESLGLTFTTGAHTDPPQD